MGTYSCPDLAIMRLISLTAQNALFNNIIEWTFQPLARSFAYIDPVRKGITVARSAISDEFFAFAVLRSMPKQRIRTGKVKNRRKSQASEGLGRMRGP